MVLGNGVQDPQQEDLIGPTAAHGGREGERLSLLVVGAHP